MKFCKYCETEITNRDEDDFCCDGAAFEATRTALQELCDYLFETDDAGDYVMGDTGIQDVNIEAMLRQINWVLGW